MGSWREGVGAAEVERGGGWRWRVSFRVLNLRLLLLFPYISVYVSSHELGRKKRKGMHEKIEEVEKTRGMRAKMKTRKREK